MERERVQGERQAWKLKRQLEREERERARERKEREVKKKREKEEREEEEKERERNEAARREREERKREEERREEEAVSREEEGRLAQRMEEEMQASTRICESCQSRLVAGAECLRTRFLFVFCVLSVCALAFWPMQLTKTCQHSTNSSASMLLPCPVQQPSAADPPAFACRRQVLLFLRAKIAGSRQAAGGFGVLGVAPLVDQTAVSVLFVLIG